MRIKQEKGSMQAKKPWMPMARFSSRSEPLYRAARAACTGHSQFQAASVNQTQGTAEPVSQGGGASAKTCLSKGRKHQRGRRGESNRGNKEEVFHGRTGTPPKGPQPVDEPTPEQVHMLEHRT